MPTISFFLATADHPVDRSHPLWEQALPKGLHPEHTGKNTKRDDKVTYGHLFSAVHRFCASDGWRRLCEAASIKLDRNVAVKELGRVSVFLVKHGAFYHPARIQLSIDDRPLFFVINVAASEQGQKALPREVNALKRLNADRPFGWFPTVYGAQFDELPLFLADWFEGFHEFHLTKKQDLEEPAITVWDGDRNRNFLSSDQAKAVYRDASMILAASYDPIAGRQIFHWHHAAGDFVVRIEGGRTTTRLITIRGYFPMVGSGSEPKEEKEVLNLLLLFFIHLSIRMRLDRFDGVLEVAWVPDRYLPSIVDGFFKGLDLAARMAGLPESFPDHFKLYLAHQAEAELFSVARQMVTSTYDDKSEEAGVVERRLVNHIRQLKRCVSL